MSDELDAGEQALWLAWKHASEAVRARVGADITAGTGLPDGDFGILTRLVDLGGGTLRQHELAQSLDWHRSRLSHHLTRMEQRGFVRRHPVTGGVEVRATEAGLAAAAAARPVHAAAVRRHLIDLLPPDLRATFRQALETLRSGPT